MYSNFYIRNGNKGQKYEGKIESYSSFILSISLICSFVI